MRFAYALLLFSSTLLAGLALPVRGGSFDRVYWCAGTSFTEGLSPAENQELEAQHIETLYWKVGELVWRAGAWRWDVFPSRPPALKQKIVPTVLMSLGEGSPAELFGSPEVLISKLRPLFAQRATETSGPLAIDFACPENLLPAYAVFLARLRQEAPELAITARPSWVANPSFADLSRSVSEFDVIFFDSQPVSKLASPDAVPPPLLDAAKAAQAMRAWGDAGVRWRAVLPSFAALNIYTVDGSWHHDIHDWTWNDLIQTTALVPVDAVADGRLGFRVTRSMHLITHGLRTGELVSVLFPDRPAIAQSLRDAQAAKASGAIFLMPNSAKAESGWSLRQLGNPACTTAEPVLICDGPRLTLVNKSAADMPPACRRKQDRGYILELLAQGPVWMEAGAGDFFGITGYADISKAEIRTLNQTDSMKGDYWTPVKPHTGVVPVAHANRLQILFSALPAGETLRSGQILLVPGASWKQIRYRVLPLQQEWKPVE